MHDTATTRAAAHWREELAKTENRDAIARAVRKAKKTPDYIYDQTFAGETEKSRGRFRPNVPGFLVSPPWLHFDLRVVPQSSTHVVVRYIGRGEWWERLSPPNGRAIVVLSPTGWVADHADGESGLSMWWSDNRRSVCARDRERLRETCRLVVAAFMELHAGSKYFALLDAAWWRREERALEAKRRKALRELTEIEHRLSCVAPVARALSEAAHG